MKKFLTLFLLALSLIWVAPSLSSKVLAQSAPSPSVVISLAPLSRQLNDVTHLIEASGMGMMGPMVRMQAEQFLKGLDRQRPHGVFLYFVEDNPEPKVMAFFAVSDIEAIYDNLAGLGVDVEEERDVTTIVPPNGQELFVRHANGFAFVSDQRDLLNNLPSAPLEELGELPNQYNVAARVLVQRIPQELRNMVLGLIEDSYMEQLNMVEEDLLAEIQGQNLDYQLSQMRSLINESKEATLGINVDKEGRRVYLDMEMVGLDGSVLAKQSLSYRDAPVSKFSGFLMDGAAVTMLASARLSAEDIPQIADMLSSLRESTIKQLEDESNMSATEIDLVKRVVGELFDVLDQTVKEGVMDMGGAIVVNDDSANIALGAHLANPDRVEGAVKEMFDLFRREIGQVAEVRLDSGKHQGITLHQIVGPIDEYNELYELVGDQMTILLGFGNGAVYLAAGSNPEPLLKTAIDGSFNAKPSDTPIQINVFLGPLMKKIGQAQGEAMVETMADKLLENKRDRIRISIRAIPNGFNYRLELQDGILEMIGAAAQAFGMGGGPDF